MQYLKTVKKIWLSCATWATPGLMLYIYKATVFAHFLF